MTQPSTAKDATAKRTYVLDTSVLLSSPNALHQFDEHDVVVPLVVVKELEGKRHDPLLGFPAREALRGLEALRAIGNINEGVTVNDAGGTVRIEINHVSRAGLPDALANDHSNDTRILAVAKNLASEGRNVTVVSKDLPMRLIAESIGLSADEYRHEMVVVDKAYTGVVEIETSHALVDALYSHDGIYLDSIDMPDDAAPIVDLPVNTGLIVSGPRTSALTVLGADRRLRTITDREAFGVKGRSAEQKIALDHLTNPDIGVVSLGGPAGTGKTFLALAAGLEQVMEQRRYKKVIVFRPLYAVGGQDLGFLPGTSEEKMAPWAGAIGDALGTMTSKECIEEIIAQEMLEVLPLTHIRGRTLNDAFVIVDEAQNLEKPVLLTALTRLGEGSKIALSHDTAQRDNMRVGRHDGIAAVVERLKGEPLFAHTTFTKSERGPVAAMVSRLMDDMV